MTLNTEHIQHLTIFKPEFDGTAMTIDPFVVLDISTNPPRIFRTITGCGDQQSKNQATISMSDHQSDIKVARYFLWSWNQIACNVLQKLKSQI